MSFLCSCLGGSSERTLPTLSFEERPSWPSLNRANVQLRAQGGNCHQMRTPGEPGGTGGNSAAFHQFLKKGRAGKHNQGWLEAAKAEFRYCTVRSHR